MASDDRDISLWPLIHAGIKVHKTQVYNAIGKKNYFTENDISKLLKFDFIKKIPGINEKTVSSYTFYNNTIDNYNNILYTPNGLTPFFEAYKTLEKCPGILSEIKKILQSYKKLGGVQDIYGVYYWCYDVATKLDKKYPELKKLYNLPGLIHAKHQYFLSAPDGAEILLEADGSLGYNTPTTEETMAEQTEAKKLIDSLKDELPTEVYNQLLSCEKEQDYQKLTKMVIKLIDEEENKPSPDTSDTEKINEKTEKIPVEKVKAEQVEKKDQQMDTKEAAEMVDMSMEQQSKVSRAIDTTKQDLAHAGYRVTATQFVRTVKEPLVTALTKNMSKGKAKQMTKALGQFFDSDVGEAFLSVMLAVAVAQVPLPNGMETKKRHLTEELRVMSYSTLGNTLADILMGPMRDALSNLVVPSLNEMEEETPEELTSGVANKNGVHKQHEAEVPS